MAVIIGNARISEKGTVNGAKGDQTGKEVMTQDWSTGGRWSYVIRPKSAEVAKKIAAAMVAACNNNNIGYSQADRLSLYNIVSKNGWNIAKAGKCNCDCSSLVAVCCNAAGVKVSPSMYTGNELNVLQATKQFDVYTKTEYTCASNKLRAGDILLRAGHTAIVTQGAVALPAATKTATTKATTTKASTTKTTTKKTTTAKLPTYTKGKVYTVQVDNLNVRTGAGTNYKIKTRAQLTADGKKHANTKGQLKKGTKVTCQASKTVSGNVWIQIPSGWVAAYYNKQYYVK